MSVKAKTNPNRVATREIGNTSGMVIWNMWRKNRAPSTSAASWMSCGMPDRPPSRMTVASGSVRQTCTVTMETIASLGWPSQMGQVVAPKMCR